MRGASRSPEGPTQSPPERRSYLPPCSGQYATQVCSAGHVTHRWTGTGAHDCPHDECGAKWAAKALRRDWDEHFEALLKLGAGVSTITVTSPAWTWPLILDVSAYARAVERTVNRTLRALCDVPQGWLIPFDLRLHPTRTKKPGWAPHGHAFVAWIAIDPESGEWRILPQPEADAFEVELREQWRRALKSLCGIVVTDRFIAVKLTSESRDPEVIREKLVAENRRHIGWGHTLIHRHRSCGAFRRWKTLREKLAIKVAPRKATTCPHVCDDGLVCGNSVTLFVAMNREDRERLLEHVVPWERHFHAHDDGTWCPCDSHRRAAELQGWESLKEWNDGWKYLRLKILPGSGIDPFTQERRAA